MILKEWLFTGQHVLGRNIESWQTYIFMCKWPMSFNDRTKFRLTWNLKQTLKRRSTKVRQSITLLVCDFHPYPWCGWKSWYSHVSDQEKLGNHGWKSELNWVTEVWRTHRTATGGWSLCGGTPGKSRISSSFFKCHETSCWPVCLLHYFTSMIRNATAVCWCLCEDDALIAVRFVFWEPYNIHKHPKYLYVVCTWSLYFYLALLWCYKHAGCFWEWILKTLVKVASKTSVSVPFRS